MDAAADRLEFAPPPQPGLARGLAIAILAHLLLLAALTWGVKWKRDAEDAAAEAELWAAVPEQAAPAPQEAVKAPPAPPPPPVVREEPKPEPKPREADIAAEKEKKRKRQEAERREAEEARKEREQKKRELEQKAKEKAAEERKREDAQKAAKDKQEQAQKGKQEQERKRRLEQLKAMAGGGAPDASGGASRSAGPTADWAGRITAKVYPNIVFSDAVPKELRVGIEIRMAPDGTIIGRPIVREPSGSREWDEAVLRGLEKTGVLPRDVDGRVHSPVIIGFSTKRRG